MVRAPSAVLEVSTPEITWTWPPSDRLAGGYPAVPARSGAPSQLPRRADDRALAAAGAPRAKTISLWVDTSSTAMGAWTTSLLEDLEHVMHVLV